MLPAAASTAGSEIIGAAPRYARRDGLEGPRQGQDRGLAREGVVLGTRTRLRDRGPAELRDQVGQRGYVLRLVVGECLHDGEGVTRENARVQR
jgi:hypothetical protein